jgi:hypothetical protein
MSEIGSQYYICVKNKGYSASLQLRTVYPGISDPEAESHGMLRIVDESGEDYLFPASFFVPIEVPEAAIHALGGRGLTTRSS